MSKIAEVILNDGEVLSRSELNSDLEFQFKILNSLDFEILKSFFIKKTIIQAVKEKQNKSNGSNGITTIELLDIFKWKDIEFYIKDLEEKKIIKKKQGVNLEMYFMCKK
jgi:hypothetical protein